MKGSGLCMLTVVFVAGELFYGNVCCLAESGKSRFYLYWSSGFSIDK